MASRGRKRKERERGRRKADKVLKRHGDECHWCGRRLTRKTRFDWTRAVSIGPDWVEVMEDGVRTRLWWVTIDHVVPLYLDGPCSLDNLVPSCGPCNRDRAVQPPALETAKWKGSPVCKCGMEKPLDWPRCPTCGARNRAMRGLGRRFYIRVAPGDCHRCGQALVELKEVRGVGMVYTCGACPQKRGRTLAEERETV